jgi:NADP-dependent aldehyde dehydrogenase
MDVQPLLLAGAWQAPCELVGHYRAENPATGEAIGPAYPVCGAADVEAALAAATEAAAVLADTPPARIATFLDAYAQAIDDDAETLVALAHAETALPAETRLAKVELPRTTRQLRLAAQAVRDFAWTSPTIDTANGLRSHFAPLGKPVAVFGPNNFPLAFNAVAGSDFASAIAARNPVIAKAHPSHPATCERLAQLAHRAVLEAGLPAATLQLLYGYDRALGLHLAGDARLGSLGFTGSRAGGMALKTAADAAGVPAYLEMSSINPVFLLPGALAERGTALAEEFFTSCTAGSGQFCTNPGLLIVPNDAAGDAFVAEAVARFKAAAPGVLFARGVMEGLQQAVDALQAAGATCLAGGHSAGPGYRFQPTLLQVSANDFIAHADALQREAFGPASLLVRTRSAEEMLALIAHLEGNLTGTVYAATDGRDDTVLEDVCRALRPRVGRLIANRMPTGVAVSAAMNHGGPWPSTAHPGFTAVGMPTAIRRFAALHCYDHMADVLLPPELRDRNPGGVARMVDGQWRNDDVESAAP